MLLLFQRDNKAILILSSACLIKFETDKVTDEESRRIAAIYWENHNLILTGAEAERLEAEIARELGAAAGLPFIVGSVERGKRQRRTNFALVMLILGVLAFIVGAVLFYLSKH